MIKGAHSNVNLSTANSPSTSVQCHRPIKGQSRVVTKNNASAINEFLQKGGTLPSVLLVDDSEECARPENKNLPSVQETNPCPRNKKMVKAVKNKKETLIDKNSSSTLSKSNTHMNELERKMEHLSCKLSTVQDILMNQMVIEAHQTSHNSQKTFNSFSAQDYTLLMLDMNCDVSARPYDPNEFSEENHSRCSGSVTRKHPIESCDLERKEILRGIQEELGRWRDERKSALKRDSPAQLSTHQTP